MWALYLASFSQTTIAQRIWDVIKVSPSLTLSDLQPIAMGMIKFKGHYQVELPALEPLNHVLSVVRVSSRLVPHQFPVKPLTLRTFISGGDSPMS